MKRFPIFKLIAVLIIVLNPVNLLSQDKDTTTTKKDSLKVDNPSNDTTNAGILSDSLKAAKPDTVIVDSTLIKLAIIKPYRRTKRKFVPLPEGIKLTFIDTAGIEAEHYLALEKHFTVDYRKFQEKSLLSVNFNGDDINTTAFVRAAPILEAEIKERKKNHYISNSEWQAYIRNMDQTLEKQVDVIVDLRSYYAPAASLDSAYFVVTLFSESIRLTPKNISLLPMVSRITDGIPWYERRAIITFSRYSNRIDLWKNRNVSLIISLIRSNLFSGPRIQNSFRFELNPPEIKESEDVNR